MSRGITCQCGHEVSAPDDEQLVSELRGHLDQDHPDLQVPDEALRAQVASGSTETGG
ncbi:MAG: DUF1059 domain-containing protein [Gemmatimonadaceae bacterium]|nr:DUF1059 domain-containing protein [Gemmatimonadaceae bacterium]